jgi:hypothetical protein
LIFFQTLFAADGTVEGTGLAERGSELGPHPFVPRMLSSARAGSELAFAVRDNPDMRFPSNRNASVDLANASAFLGRLSLDFGGTIAATFNVRSTLFAPCLPANDPKADHPIARDGGWGE